MTESAADSDRALPSTLAWSDPNADPIGELRRYMDAMKDVVIVTKIEVSDITRAALRAARSDAQRGSLVPGLSGLWWSVGVYVDADVPDGKARVTYSDGSVKVIP